MNNKNIYNYYFKYYINKYIINKKNIIRNIHEIQGL